MTGRHIYQHRTDLPDDATEDMCTTGFATYKAGTLPLPFNYFEMAPLIPPELAQYHYGKFCLLYHYGKL